MFVAFGRWLYGSPIAQAVVGGIAVLLLWMGNGAMKERRGRIRERRRQREAEQEAIGEVREESHDRIINAENNRRNRGAYPTSDSLPDDARRVLIRDRNRGTDRA